MLQVNALTKRFGARPLFEAASFVVNDGEVAGVVGPNGSGKTTLLQVIAGALAPDGGSVATTAGSRLGLLRQGYALDPDAHVGALFAHAFAEREAERRLTDVSARLAVEDGDAGLHEEYDAALDLLAFAEANGAADAWQALGLRQIEADEAIGRLSGGEQTKLALIDLVASRPDVLLLDEPTNNLDLDALAWLDDWLDAFAGPVLLVSHDRALLDDHATQILELDAARARIESFAGNYESYAAEKARREADLWKRFRRQQEHETRVKREIRAIKQTAQGREHMSQNDFYRRKAKKVARRAVVLERRLERELDGADRIEKPMRRTYRVKADLGEAARSGDRMLAAEGVSLSAGGQVLLRDASFAIGWGERVVLVGANGSGKTTLLRALVGERTPDAGTVRLSPSARIGYLPQDEAEAASAATPVDVVRASGLSETEARRFLHRFLFSGDDALRPVARLSYGERRRLSLARIVLGGANLLVLDEPTNHLDIPSREAFEAALEAYEGAMLAVTHDRYFIDRFASAVYAIEESALVRRWQ